MDDATFFMQIQQCFCDLSNDMTTQVFAEIGQTNDLMEQFASRAQLKHDIVILPRFGKVNQSDDIGMIKLSHDLDLFQNVCSL